MLKLQEDWKIEDNGILQIWNTYQAAGEVVNVLELKNRVLEEIKQDWFPDLNFLFSPQSLCVSVDVFKELLLEEENIFTKLLNKNINDLEFSDIDDFS